MLNNCIWCPARTAADPGKNAEGLSEAIEVTSDEWFITAVVPDSTSVVEQLGLWWAPRVYARSPLLKPRPGRARTTLFLKLAFFGRISGALEVDAVAVGVGERCYPQAVSNKWTLLSVYSA